MPARDGICDHPKIVFENQYPRYESDPYTRVYEKQCISHSKSFAPRRGDELVTWPAEVVRVNGQWQLNRWAPSGSPPR